MQAYFHHVRTYPLIGLLALLLLLAGCASRLHHPQDAYKEAKYAKAAEQGEQWLEMHPDDREAREITGRSWIALGDSSRAFTILSPLAGSPETSEMRDLILHLAMSGGHLDVARSILTNQLSSRKQSENFDRLFLQVKKRMEMAETAAREGDNSFAAREWARAATSYRSALEEYSGNSSYRGKLHLAQARLLVEKKGEDGLGKAESHLGEAAKALKNDPLIPWVRGDIHLALGNLELAKQAFSEAVDQGIQSPYRSRALAVIRDK